MEDDREIFGTEIVGEGKVGKSCFFRVRDILFIDCWVPKKNYKVPRFYTLTGVFTVPLTLEACANGLPFLTLLDTGTFVNVEHIDYIEDLGHSAIVHFKGSPYTTNMAKYKVKYFRHLLKQT